jgi:hypothetical protein
VGSFWDCANVAISERNNFSTRGTKSPGRQVIWVTKFLPRLSIIIGPQCAFPASFHTSLAYSFAKVIRFWSNVHTPAVHQNPNHLFHIQPLTLQREMLPLFNVERFCLKETESFLIHYGEIVQHRSENTFN